MPGNVSLSPAAFRIGVYFVSRKNSDFFEKFFMEERSCMACRVLGRAK